MERTDWLAGGFDSAQAEFLMLKAITHHRFSSRVWGEQEIRRLYASSRRSMFPRRRCSRPGAAPVPGSAAPLSGHGGRRRKLADDRFWTAAAADWPLAWVITGRRRGRPGEPVKQST